MTKKSQARLQRDQVAKDAKEQGVKSVYAHLESMYQSQHGLFGKYAEMIGLVSHDEVAPFMKDPVRVGALLKGMSADIDELIPRIEALYVKHKGKAGYPDPTDEDEYFDMIQTHQSYVVMQGVHQNNLLPAMLELDEHLRDALRTKEAHKAQAAAAAAAAVIPVTENTIVIEGDTQIVAAPSGNAYEAPAIDTAQ